VNLGSTHRTPLFQIGIVSRIHDSWGAVPTLTLYQFLRPVFLRLLASGANPTDEELAKAIEEEASRVLTT
jgi:hypothetical protein